MAMADLPQVVEIERECFSQPWPPSAFIKDIDDSRSLCLVADRAGRVEGYAIAWFVSDELHLANLAVRLECRRQGLAMRLLDELFRQARLRGTRMAWLEVRVTNEPAIALYRRYGFREVALRRKYYEPEREDALVMLCELKNVGER